MAAIGSGSRVRIKVGAKGRAARELGARYADRVFSVANHAHSGVFLDTPRGLVIVPVEDLELVQDLEAVAC